MNKLKGSSKTVKMKHIVILFAVSLVVALPLRTYQLLALIDPVSGFYEISDFTVPLLFGVMALFTLLFLALGFVCSDVPAPELKTGKNPLLGIASLLAAGGMIWDAAVLESKIIPQMSGYQNFDIFKQLLLVYLEENGGSVLIFEFVFAVISTVYFLLFAVSQFEGKPHYKKTPVLALAPLCWSMTVLVSKLITAISFITVTELMFEIFMFVFTMAFLLTYARISTGMFTENSMWGVFGYGFAAAFFGAIVSVPRLICKFAGTEPVEGNEFNFTYFAIFVFTVVAVFSALGIGYKHGLRNIKAASELELPDDTEVVVKGSDIADITDFHEDENKAASGTVLESVLDYGIDEALDDYLEEMEAEEKISEVAQETVTVEDVEENSASYEETVVEEVPEVAQEIVTVEDVEENSVFYEEPVSEKIDDVEENVSVFAEETVAEEIPEIAEEVAEAEEPEEVFGNADSEDFVDFSQMLIEDNGDFDDDVDDELAVDTSVAPLQTETAPEKPEVKKSKKNSEKVKKAKKSRGKKKNSEAVEEPIKVISLADMKKKTK